MTRTRLCFVVESGTDVRLAEGLAERYQLTVLARRIDGGVEVSQPPEPPIDVRVGSPSRVAFARAVYRDLRAARDRYDAVLVQGYGLSALAANLAARRTGISTTMLVCSPVEAYYRCRQVDPDRARPYRRRELMGLRILARWNAKLGQRYVVLSAYLEQVVLHHGTRRPIHVIPVYGVDLARFAPPSAPKLDIRRERGLSEYGQVVFFSSRVAPEKDADTLLRAVKMLKVGGRSLWLLHRSGGFRTLLERAKRYGLEERVVATDAVHPHRHLPLDYQASDLCVQASREEGLGFSPLEAMACGVPVVASAVGGLTETVRDGETGWTYPVGDHAQLARVMTEALDDPAEAARRAARGRELVADRYERDLVFGALEGILGGARAPIAHAKPVQA